MHLRPCGNLAATSFEFSKKISQKSAFAFADWSGLPAHGRCIGRVICHAFSNSPAMGQYSQYENLARNDQHAWICVAQPYRIQAYQ